MAKVNSRRPITDLARWLARSNKKMEPIEEDLKVIFMRDANTGFLQQYDRKEQGHGQFRLFSYILILLYSIFTYCKEAVFSRAKRLIKGKPS
jgi:hypothetical protein